MTRFMTLWNRARQSAVAYGILVNGVRVFSQLLLLPLIVNSAFLSKSDQALWWVFLAVGKLANLADFGLGEVISRVYSYFWAGAEEYRSEGLGPPPASGEPNLPRLRELDRALGYVYLRISIIATTLVAIGGSAFLYTSMQTTPNPVRHWITWCGYMVIIGYGLASNRWVLACQGINRVKECQIAALWASLCSLLCAGVLLLTHCGLLSLVVANALQSLVLRELCRRAYHRAVPFAGKVKLDLGIVRQLWPNTRKFGVILVGGYLLGSGPTLISKALLDDATTASWGLTIKMGEFLASVSSLWLMVKWPQIAGLRTQGRLEEMSVLFARRLALVMVTFVLGAGAVLLLGSAFLRLKGGYTTLLPTPMLIVYLFYLGQNLFYGQFGMLVFTENVVPFMKLAIGTGIGMCFLSMWLTPILGLWGLLLAPLIAEGVGSSWYVVRRGLQSQLLRPAQLLRAALAGRI